MLDQENELSKRRQEAAALVSDREKVIKELEDVSGVDCFLFAFLLCW